MQRYDGNGVVRVRSVGNGRWRADSGFAALLDRCRVEWDWCGNGVDSWCEFASDQLDALTEGIKGNVVLHRACATCGDRFNAVRRS